MPTFIDVFCGPGGFTQGARQAGLHHIMGVDIDRHACATYAANHGKVICGDISNLSATELRRHAGANKVDVVLGSPPCQSMSLMGNTPITPHTNDNLFMEVIRVANVFDARVVVIENVPRMETKLGGSVMHELMDALEASGFDTCSKTLNAEEHEVPQKRRRLFVVALRRRPHTIPTPFKWPVPVLHFDPSFRTIMQTDDQVAAAYERYGYNVHMSDEKAAYYMNRKATPGRETFVRWIDPGKVALTMRSGYMKGRGAEALLLRDIRDGSVITSPQDVDKDMNVLMRMLTVDEAKAIQSFPPGYVFKGPVGDMYKQIGNAVPVKLAYHVCSSVKDMLD